MAHYYSAVYTGAIVTAVVAGTSIFIGVTQEPKVCRGIENVVKTAGAVPKYDVPKINFPDPLIIVVDKLCPASPESVERKFDDVVDELNSAQSKEGPIPACGDIGEIKELLKGVFSARSVLTITLAKRTDAIKPKKRCRR